MSRKFTRAEKLILERERDVNGITAVAAHAEARQRIALALCVDAGRVDRWFARNKAAARTTTEQTTELEAAATTLFPASVPMVPVVAVTGSEHRLSPLRSKASQSVRDRIQRAKAQRMFLVTRHVHEALHHEFAVLGSTGNVYTVNISRLPDCSCPDFQKGNLCKHILFVYLKVLRVNEHSHVIFQKALLTSELTEIFATAAQHDPAVLANGTVVAKYKTMTSELQEGADDLNGAMRQRSWQDTSCPICFEEFEETDALVWCQASCGNNMHRACFDNWQKATKAKGSAVNCVFCRAEWVSLTGADNGVQKKRKQEEAVGEDGFLNLGEEAGLDRNRDTSSYSRWGRYGSGPGYRRRRYGGFWDDGVF